MLFSLAIAYSPTESALVSLPRGYYTIGRKDDNHIIIPNQYVSGYHCTLLAVDKDGGDLCWLVVDGRIFNDKSSSNGTWINGARITNPCLLKHQDVIRFSNREYPKLTFHQLAKLNEQGDTAAHEHQ